jgi:DNA-binding transcriptional MerR regulator
MTLTEIAEASGLPARTIRFYIARGLLKEPATRGRSASYTAEHLAGLEQIKRLQAAGHTLSEIARVLNGSSEDKPAAAAPTAWWQHAIADDVVVWVKAGGSPWRTKQLRAAVDDFARRVQAEKNEGEQE